jgi:hypothetical protein
MPDKVVEILLDVLKQALAVSGDHRLYRSGRLEGLFAGRTGIQGEASAKALSDGLLEVVRKETKGKSTVEWVRATHRATEFLHEHESPMQALKDLHGILQPGKDSVPLWLAEIRQQLQMLSKKLEEEAGRWTHCLQALSEQVEKALQQAHASPVPLSNGLVADIPWAPDALAYLERRRLNAGTAPCPLPELFAAVHDRHADLSISAFHERLRRLQDHRLLRLLPFDGPASGISQPEYALADGTGLLYYATR